MMPKQSSGGSRHSMNNNNIAPRGALVDPQTYGMLLWQSKLQEKLLQEQKETKEREKEEEQQRKAKERLRREQESERQKREQEERLANQEKQVQSEPARERSEESQQSREIEIPPQMFPGPAPYVISSSKNIVERKQSSAESQQNSQPSNGPGMFPNITSRIRTSVSCDNFGKPPVPLSSSSSAMLGNIVSFQQMGGAGSPRRTPSGKLVTTCHCHPEIRYHQKDTRNFDQTIRYLMDRDKVKEYKRELDQQLEEQRRWRSRLGSGQIKEITRKAFIENGSDRNRYIDYSNPHLQVISPPNHQDQHQPQQQNRNGIELAPLIRKFNSLPKLNTLSSTDVTRPFVHSPRNEFFHPVQPNEVAESLTTQLREKEWLQRRQQERERQATEKHFQTWDRFWGRPGAGAPIPFSQKTMGHAVSFANLHDGHTFYAPSGGGGAGGGMGYNRVNLFKALHMTHQQPNRPK